MPTRHLFEIDVPADHAFTQRAERSNANTDGPLWFFDAEHGHAARAHLFEQFANGIEELFLGADEIGSDQVINGVEPPPTEDHAAAERADLDAAFATNLDRFDFLFESAGDRPKPESDQTTALLATSLVAAGTGHAARKERDSRRTTKSKGPGPRRLRS